MNKAEAKVRLDLVQQFSEKWHRHSEEHEANARAGEGDFEAGMMRAYAESIRLALGSNESVTAIEAYLESGRL